MNNPCQTRHKELKRNLIFILLPVLFVLLSSCGGGGFQTVLNGVGGTGITMGKISSFGSIHVNGIDFNTDNATFTRDGVTAKIQSDFHTGEIVTVTGQVDRNTKTGVATSVVFSDILEGPVSSVATGNTIRILDQNIVTNSLTVFHGFEKLSDLVVGNIVEISGFTSSKGDINATSLTLIETAFTDGMVIGVEGNISQLNTAERTFKINNLTINYANAMFSNISENELVDGLYLGVDTNKNIINNTLVASVVERIENTLNSGDIYEVEGLVSRFTSSADFDVDELSVITNDKTAFINGVPADVKLDTFMRINGTVNAQGVIVASEITFLELPVASLIEGIVEAVDTSASTITVLGNTFVIDLFTLLTDETTEDFTPINLEQFVVGDAVFIVADKEGSTLTAIRLSKIAAITSVFLSSQVENFDTGLALLTIFGHTVMTNENTQYFDEEGFSITPSVFFDTLVDGSTVVDVTGYLAENNVILADVIGIQNDF